MTQSAIVAMTVEEVSELVGRVKKRHRVEHIACQLLDFPFEVLSLIISHLDKATFAVFRTLCRQTRDAADNDAHSLFWRDHAATFFAYYASFMTAEEQLEFLYQKMMMAKAAREPIVINCNRDDVTTPLLAKYDALFMAEGLKFGLRAPKLASVRLNCLKAVVTLDILGDECCCIEAECSLYPPNLETLLFRMCCMETKNLDLNHLPSLRVIFAEQQNFGAFDGAKFPLQLESLTIENSSVTEFKNLSRLSKLKTLWIDSENLESVDGKGLPPTLTYLRIHGTNVTALCNLDALKRLEKLDLFSATIESALSLPKSLKKLTLQDCTINRDALRLPASLKTLNIPDSSLTTIPAGLSTLAALEVLDLSMNDLKTISAEKLPPNLVKLNLESNGRLKHISGLDSLARLQHLYLNCTAFGGTDGCISYPASLESLDVFLRPHAHLWKHQFPLSLRMLHLNKTDPEHLVDYTFTSHLHTLKIRCLMLSVIDGIIFPPTLKALSIKGSIKSIDHAQFPDGLQSLDLANNSIAQISHPGLPASLIRLDLQGNALSCISQKSLPVSLEFLHLTGNRIVPSACRFDHLVKLRKLMLSYNQLSSIDSLSLPPSLHHLDLSHNEFTTLKGLQLPPSLRSLTLSKNTFTSFGWPALPDNLRLLDLSGCQITSFKDIRWSEKLLVLGLTGTAIKNFAGLQISPMTLVKRCLS